MVSCDDVSAPVPVKQSGPARARRMRVKAPPLAEAAGGSALLSLLKFAGAKWWVHEKVPHLLPEPANVTAYREPFCGTIAVGTKYLGKVPCVISDAYAPLIAMYEGVRADPLAVRAQLLELVGAHFAAESREEQQAHYYGIRDDFNQSISASAVRRAAWMIYLNRTCYNGLQRVNLKKGEFNVPVGKYKSVSVPSEATFLAWSAALKDATLSACDFMKTIFLVVRGAFYFLDSPYVAASKSANFTNYSGVFGPKEQAALAESLSEIDAGGARFMLTNSAMARPLYEGRWNILEVGVDRSISCKVGQRAKAKEIVVTNYADLCL